MKHLLSFKPEPHTFDDDYCCDSPDPSTKRICRFNQSLQQSPGINTGDSKLKEMNPLDTEATNKSKKCAKKQRTVSNFDTNKVKEVEDFDLISNELQNYYNKSMYRKTETINPYSLEHNGRWKIARETHCTSKDSSTTRFSQTTKFKDNFLKKLIKCSSVTRYRAVEKEQNEQGQSSLLLKAQYSDFDCSTESKPAQISVEVLKDSKVIQINTDSQEHNEQLINAEQQIDAFIHQRNNPKLKREISKVEINLFEEDNRFKTIENQANHSLLQNYVNNDEIDNTKYCTMVNTKFGLPTKKMTQKIVHTEYSL